MIKSYIEFKKQRDFGELLSDTFNFIRDEFKPFMKMVLTISAPALILFIIGMTFYTYSVTDALVYNPNYTFGFTIKDPILFLSSFGLYLLTFFIALMFMSSSTLHYIKSYINNSGNVDSEEVKRNVNKTILSFMGLGFLKWLTISVTIAICVLPVLYFMVPMYIVFSIYIFEPKQSSTDAYGKSYSLINEDFWLSIGLIIVIAILYYVISLVFSIPSGIYSFIQQGVYSGEIDPGSLTNSVDPIFILINVISTFFGILLNLIPTTAGVFLYFHLNEKRNFTGTFERISNIGNTEE